MKTTVKIEGMSCAHCAMRVEKALNALEGISASVNLASGSATVESDGDIDRDRLADAVRTAGYSLVP